MSIKSIYKNIQDMDTMHDKAFYGFKVDSTGNLNVDIIRTNDSDAIILPEEDSDFIKDPDAYKQHFWSADAFTFRMNKNTGHLEMVIL